MFTIEQAQSIANHVRCYGRVKNIAEIEMMAFPIGSDMIAPKMERLQSGESMMYGITAEGILRLMQIGATMNGETGADGKGILIFDWVIENK